MFQVYFKIQFKPIQYRKRTNQRQRAKASPVVDNQSKFQTVIGHVRYINILTWLRGFRVKNVNFLSFFCLSIPKRDSNTKKTTPNIAVWPESLGAMLEYWYIERGLLDDTQVC